MQLDEFIEQFDAEVSRDLEAARAHLQQLESVEQWLNDGKALLSEFTEEKSAPVPDPPSRRRGPTRPSVPKPKPPSGGRGRAVSDDEIAKVAMEIVGQEGVVSTGQIAKRLGRQNSVMRNTGRILSELCDQGKLADAGQIGKGRKYHRPATAPRRNDTGQAMGNGQPPTLNGRVLAILIRKSLTLADLCAELPDEDPEALRQVVKKLEADDDLRAERRNGRTVYVGQP